MKKIFIIGIMCVMGAMGAKAQFDETNNLFYHLVRTPQSNYLNPAFYPIKTTFYINLPGTELQFGSPLAMTDVIHYDKSSQTTVIDLDNILSCLSKENKFRLGANVNVFGFGFKVKNMFFTFSSRLTNTVNMGLPVSAIDALRVGNMNDDGTVRPVVELLSGDVVNATSYLETALGAAYSFDNLHLTVGLRAKLLYGVLNIRTDNTKLEFVTDPSMDSVTARMYYEVQSAACVPYDTATGFDINVGDLFNLGKANTGLAFDLGAKYDWGPFTFSLAINDLSAGIHWKNNVITWRPQGGQGVIEFTGMDVSSILDHGEMSTDSLSAYIEERLGNMTPTMVDSGDYWFAVPTKINLGASYSFAKMFRAGLLFHGQFDRGLLCKGNDGVENTFRFNTTLSCSVNLANWVEAVVGSSIVYDGESLDLFNPGFGLILTPGTFFQLYFMTDYVSSFYLTDSKAFNIKVGLGLLF